MKGQTLHSKRARYGGMTAALTVTIVAAVVLANYVFSVLANHYHWYTDMTTGGVYSLSDDAQELLRREIDEANRTRETPVVANIIFAEDYRQYEVGSVGGYIYNIARELEQAFPDTVHVSWFDCWTEKKRADALGVTSPSNVVLEVEGGERRVFSQREFFAFAAGDTTTPLGFDGERVFAATLASLMAGDRPLACVTVNHGEIFYDYQLLYLLRDAGYSYMFLDSYASDIPEDCELLLMYNPNTDLMVADSFSDRDELVALRTYLDRGGKLALFLSSGTPELPHLETLLSEFGMSLLRSSDPATGIFYNAMVRDDSAALSADGYTLLAAYADTGRGGEILSGLRDESYTPPVVFRDATALCPADGFARRGDGDLVSADGSRRATTLFTASGEATAWAVGKRLDTAGQSLALMMLGEDSNTGGQLLAVSSTYFAEETYVRSAVFGNADVLNTALTALGKEHVLIGLRYKPFPVSMSISVLTTVQTRNWTLALTITPAVIVLVAAVIILVRRKNA